MAESVLTPSVRPPVVVLNSCISDSPWAAHATSCSKGSMTPSRYRPTSQHPMDQTYVRARWESIGSLLRRPRRTGAHSVDKPCPGTWTGWTETHAAEPLENSQRV